MKLFSPVLLLLFSLGWGCKEKDFDSSPFQYTVAKNIQPAAFQNLFDLNPKKAKIHSHNDYDHARPFADAYDNQAFSIEADVWNTGTDSTLLIGHLVGDPNRLFKKMYVDTIVSLFKKYNGKVSADPTYSFILMLDVKTEAYSTIRQIVRELERIRSANPC